MRYIAIDVIGWSGGIAWLAGSAFFAIQGDGAMFQRMGAAGVAAAVLYFSFMPRPIAAPYRHHDIAKTSMITMDQISRGGAIALARTTVLAQYLKMQRESEKEPESATLNALSRPIDHAIGILSKDHSSESAMLAHRAETVRSEANDADTFVKSAHSRLSLFEASFLVLGTLQWGFGDLLFL